jgi:hypothetical protein
MGVIPFPLRGDVVEEICIQHVQHLVQDYTTAKAFGRKPWHPGRRIPEQCAQIYHVGLTVLISKCPFTWVAVRVAAKCDPSSSS